MQKQLQKLIQAGYVVRMGQDLTNGLYIVLVENHDMQYCSDKLSDAIDEAYKSLIDED